MFELIWYQRILHTRSGRILMWDCSLTEAGDAYPGVVILYQGD